MPSKRFNKEYERVKELKGKILNLVSETESLGPLYVAMVTLVDLIEQEMPGLAVKKRIILAKSKIL